MSELELIGGQVVRAVTTSLPDVSRLTELSHPCLERFVTDGDDLFRVYFGPSVSLLTLADVSAQGKLEPELLGTILGRAGLGILELYSIMEPPLRALEAEGIRLYKDGQVRFDPLPYLRAGGTGDRPFVGAPAGTAPAAPFPLRPLGIDAYALVMLFFELLSDPSIESPLEPERPDSVLDVARRLLFWGARTEQDLSGVFNGLLEREFQDDHEMSESDSLDEVDPEAHVEVNGLLVDKHLVSNERYARFCQQTGHAPPAHWDSRTAPEGLEDAPVTGVGFQDARAFAQHSGGRLLRGNEWRALCLGEFPWGDRYDDAIASRSWLEPANVRAIGPLMAHNTGRAGISNLCELWEWTHEGGIVGGPWPDEIAPGRSTHAIAEENPRTDLSFRVIYPL